LQHIPTLSFFQIYGIPQTGLTIVSPPNDLTVSVESIPNWLDQVYQEGRYWLGSAAAVLQWKGRTLKSRVMYEYFMIPEFNRLSRNFWGLWKHFQGLYIVIEGLGDLYVLSQESAMIASFLRTHNSLFSKVSQTKILNV
jgi:hypothetical protein